MTINEVAQLQDEPVPPNEEQIEGLGDTEDNGLGDYPIDTLTYPKGDTYSL